MARNHNLLLALDDATLISYGYRFWGQKKKKPIVKNYVLVIIVLMNILSCKLGCSLVSRPGATF